MSHTHDPGGRLLTSDFGPAEYKKCRKEGKHKHPIIEPTTDCADLTVSVSIFIKTARKIVRPDIKANTEDEPL